MARLIGTSGNDDLNANFRPGYFEGRGGDDSLSGQFFNDTIFGGTGNDEAFGGEGDDIIHGDAGDDFLQTGTGNDLIYGGAGADDITLYINAAPGTTAGYGGAGDDIVRLYGPTSLRAEGGAGQDQLEVSDNSFQNPGPGSGLNLDFAAGTIFNKGTGTTSTFTGFERLTLRLAFGNDTIRASDNDDQLYLGAGNMRVAAGDGDDVVGYYVNGGDTLSGGAGQDTLIAGGANAFGPGPSLDALFFDASSGTVDDGHASQITGFEVYHATGTIGADFAALFTGNDSFEGSWGDDTGLGLAGADVLHGERGSDSLSGGDGADLLYGGFDDDSLDGGAGQDLLRSGYGNDLILAGDGADRIFLDHGQDTASGGAGADRFIFTGTETHTITDFASGEDRLLFKPALLLDGPASGPLDPALLATGSPTGTAAQFILSYDASTDQTLLTWDANGTDPDGTITLARFTGDIAVTAADIFIL